MDLSMHAQARLAVAAAAQDLSDRARSLVTVHPDDTRELVELAHQLVQQAEEIQLLAVTAAREAGVSWQDVGQQLGDVTKQSAHARFASGVEEVRERIIFPGREGSAGSPGWWACPDGLEDPKRTLRRLDAWSARHRERTDPKRDEAPVSAGIHAINDTHPGISGIALVTDLAKRLVDRQLPDGVTEEDARVLLAQAKVRTYDRIAATTSGLRADEARTLAQHARNELAHLERA
ncbi:hypothetical protein GKE82_26375 [Conexibacter sp. W3-3-2]|uniref:hypothetical protein n=1 Tax=Conexibacter sp. W3-3-2 TaxID=2675227 RepID=UPI0012B9029C|nr:hypothetical protein [Conexibacter sp. W3-3-2]MTD47643.1 hypothetical protein [Conexibacter sp. W3-3-2]MTD47731.1 hypothetical protein [Conexibacter sp. W3-3-2]